METIFGKNIKLLRKRSGRTQDDVAAALEIKRPTLSGYENGVAEPGIQTLLLFSKYFNVSVDTLVKEDLSQLGESTLSQLVRGFDIFVNGGSLRVLTTTIDSSNIENIELVNQKASAGYRTGFADPEFIKVLPTFQLPFLSREKKYRTFQVNGDSMLPIPHGSWITGEFLQNWRSLRNGTPAIILTMEDGIMFKLVENRLETEGMLVLHSLNPIYSSYNVYAKDIREIWTFVHYISSEIPEPNLPKNELNTALTSIKQEMAEIKEQLKQGKLF